LLAVTATLGLSLAASAGQASALPSEPSLANVSSSAVTQTAATLNARIGTGGAETTYRFEYGTSVVYGSSVPLPDADIGAEGVITVGQEITGLQPGTTYHYRAVATNSAGRVLGSDEAFTTAPLRPPVVSTGQASGVSEGAATLTGTVDTAGFETVYEFDLGVDTSYGTRIFGDAGAEPGAQTFAFPLQGLTPGTTYHYRILATSVFGTSYGVDQTFTTVSYPGATLAAPVTSALVPTSLLAVAGANVATAASAGSTAHTASHGKSVKRASRSREGKQSRTSHESRRHHSADRRAKR
jgi:phosphodiesterase/alkaline phosphatase D-like protein